MSNPPESRRMPSAHNSVQHHASNPSFGSSAGFRQSSAAESHDSALQSSLSTSTVVINGSSSVNAFNEKADPSAAMSFASMSTDNSSQLFIASIVQRLVNKLPCNSGWRLQLLEEDELMRSSVANLISLSCYQLGGVVRELLGALDVLIKQSSQQRLEQQLSIGMLHSQLFLLKVLVSCMNHHWRITAVEGRDLPHEVHVPGGLTHVHLDASHGAHMRAQTAPTDAWSDPPPMDDTYAKHVLFVMTTLIKQNVTREEAHFASGHEVTDSKGKPLDTAHAASSKSLSSDRSLRDLTHRDATASFSSPKSFGQTSSRTGRDDAETREEAVASPVAEKHPESFMPSSLCLAGATSIFVLYPAFPPTRVPFAVSAAYSRTTGPREPPRFNASSWQLMTFSREIESSDVPSHLQTRIYRLASQVVFYLSSSNWIVVSERLKNRLRYLSAAPEENPVTSELRLLECSNLQRSRLSSILQELSTSFLHLRRSAQYTTALVFRRAVWTWIQYYPTEFASLVGSNKRIEGSPDVLFDQVYSLADSTKRKIAFWPLLTALLILCPDLVGKAAVGESRKASGSLGKKLSFLESLRKAQRNASLVDVATLCSVDLCKAAASTPRSETSLRLLVHDIETELKDRLFDPQRIVLPQNKIIDTSLMIDLFVALFRLDAQRVMRELVPVCMSDSSPIVFKIVLVHACVLLASEKHKLPWAPDVSLLYPQIARSLRITFKESVYCLEQSEAKEKVRNEKRSVPKVAHYKSALSDEDGRQELLKSILQLWILDFTALSYGIDLKCPRAVASLHPAATLTDLETLYRAVLPVDSVLSVNIATTVLFSSPPRFSSFRSTTAFLMLKLYSAQSSDPTTIEFLQQQRETGIACAPLFMTGVAEQAINTEYTSMQRHYLELMVRSQRRLGQFFRLGDDAKKITDHSHYSSARERTAELVYIQLVVLLMMCSSDTEVCSTAMQCAGAHVGVIKAMPIHYSPMTSEWIRFFADLSDSSFIQTGRIAQQKRIRALLRDIETPSAASWIAWKEAYKRWKALTQLVARPVAEETASAQDMAAQWHNYAGFLCAFGGACFSADFELASTIQPMLADVLPRHADTEQPAPMIERFLQEMVDLLVSDSLWVREKAKETLGVDLGPRLIGILFRQIHAVLSDFFNKGTGYPKTSDMYTVFVEQSIGVASMVLNRLDETKTLPFTSNVDIGSLMVLYVEYANSLGRDEHASRIKTAMCQMCESLMRKKNAFSFSNELRVRNRLFQALTTWTSDGPDDNAVSNDTLDKLHRELDVSCLKCISIFLDKLPLLLADDALLLDDKVEWAKTRHFALYFGYFIKILNRTRHGSRFRADTKSVAVKGKDYAPLRESAILALSNLLASNIDSGLHNSLPLAYHEDPRLRTAFMQIMTNVLNQGTAFDELEQLGGTREQNKLVDLVCQDNLQLALAICQVCPGREVESTSVLLLSMFDTRGGVIRFLKAAVEEEIQRTATEEMVFRSNSFCTALLSTFARTHGYDYLRSIMAPLITELARKPEGYSFEMDPSRVEPGESTAKNQAALEEIAQAFIDSICSSAHRVPAVLRELCRHIRNVLDARFPASRYQGVGGLMFLRFISPAVVSPHMIDINLTGPSKDFRRGLVLISKILITLASNNLFSGHKEPFMTGLNDFLKGNVWKVATFLDQVSDARTDPDRLYAADQPLGYGIQPNVHGIDGRDQRALHRFLFDHIDKIGRNLLARGSRPTDTDKGELIYQLSTYGHQDVNLVYDRLCEVLSESDEPKPDDMPELTFTSVNFQEFLRRHAGRNMDEESYRTVFYEGPPSRSGRPVLYYTMRNQKADTIDFEGLILYILQTLETFANRPYDVVIDTTACLPANVTPGQWMLYFSSLVPAPVLANACNVVFVNPNTTVKIELSSWNTPAYRDSQLKYELADKMTSLQNVAHCSTLSQIELFIDPRNLSLDKHTVAVLTCPVEVKFDQITLVWYYRTLTPVTFTIGGEYLQITALKQQEWLPHLSVTINDVFHLSDIDDVRSISLRGEDNTFLLSCRGGSMNFVFTSNDRAEIVQALRQAKARVSKFRASNASDRILKPSDVPGTLLNMAMLNITSNDHALRLGAYNLLCALSTSFNFGASSARRRLLSSRGLALPANTMGFVSDLSRDFAVAAPGVTLEFLLSFFDGFERAAPSQKTMCLHYMSPWLSNLVLFVHTSREQQSEYQKRIKEILNQLISITTKQPDMYAIMQRCVWSQLSKLDDLIPLFLEVFAEAAMDSGLHTERFEAVLDTMVSFASINLRGKMLSRLRKVIAKTAQEPVVSQLHQNASWKEIATLVRMNMVLSFTNRVEALLYLPELLHIVLLLAGNGVDATRYAIYGSAINLIHSLCTEDPREAKKPEEATPRMAESVAKLRVLLERLAEPEYLKLFGLVEGQHAFNASQDLVRETPDSAAIERLAMLMYEIADMAAPSVDAANSWRARLTSLVTSTAFQYNPIIQSRAFVLLGCLAQGEVDDDLLYQILVSLRGSISEWASSNSDMPMISIVTCLSKVVQILPMQSRYLPQMFWLGIAMIQCGHVALFKAGIALVYATVQCIWERNIPATAGTDFITFLLDARFEFREDACKLDDETGIDFEINFSFATAALLVKGLRHPSTRETTTQLMQALLHHCAVDANGELKSQNGRISTSQLGFFIGLLPTATRPEDFGWLLQLAGVDEQACDEAVQARKEGYNGLFEYLDVLENKIALLVVTLVSSLLQHAESDAERLLLYGFLEEAARQIPAIVSILYDSLAPSMKDIFVNCSNGAILDAVHGIAQTAVSQPFFAAQARETTKRGGPSAYLEESGYASLLSCGTFVPLSEARRHVLGNLAIQLVLGLTDVGTT